MIDLWRRDGTGDVVRVPFECGSWRCPACRPWVASLDYARISKALQDGRRWVYAVLTVDPTKAHNDRSSVWTEASSWWNQRLRKSLARRYGRIAYVQTWEQHKTGRPHMNVVLTGLGLLQRIDAMGERPSRRQMADRRSRRILRWRAELRHLVMQSGYGAVLWVEPLWTEAGVQDNAALAGYLVKAGKGLGLGAARELSTPGAKDQTPLVAPPGFRRMRASRGTLEPRYRTGGEYTGALAWKDSPFPTRLQIDGLEECKLLKIHEIMTCYRNHLRNGLPIPRELVRLVRRYGYQEKEGQR